MTWFDRLRQRWQGNSKNHWQVTHDGEVRIIQRPQADVPGNQYLPLPPPQPRPLALRTGEKLTGDAARDAEIIIEAYQTCLNQAQREPVTLAKRQRLALPDDTLLLRRARPILFEPLPLMGDPFGCDPAWRERAITRIRALRRYLNDEQRITLELAERHPDWVHGDIQIWAPDAPTWRAPNVDYQIAPTLQGVLRSTLDIDLAECSQGPIHHTDDPSLIMWSAILWVDDRLDDGLGELEAAS